MKGDGDTRLIINFMWLHKEKTKNVCDYYWLRPSDIDCHSFLNFVASLLAYHVCFPQTVSSLCFGRIDWASASHFLAAVGDWVFIDQPSNFKLSNVPIVYYKMCIIFPQSGNAILTQNIYSLFVKSYYSRLPFCEKSLPNVRWNN